LTRFSREDRLVSKHDFQSVFAQPAKMSRSYLTVLYRPNSFGRPRLGLMVGKKYFKRAVDRNRVRRVLRESFRQRKSQMKGLDIVLIVRSECAVLSAKALREKVDRLWLEFV
jgi:ribonuclease P protein component